MPYYLILILFALGTSPKHTRLHQTNLIKKTIDVELIFVHQFGDQDFEFRKKFVNIFGDTIDFQRFQYYLSNFSCKDHEDKIWSEKNSYHLVELKPGQGNQVVLTLKGVPLKQIHQISFGIGVDKSRNHGGIQNGALDPIKGMFWTWSQGYIFLKSESYHYQIPGKRKGLIFHIGGDECFRTLTFDIDSAQITPKKSRIRIPIHVDVQKLFGGFSKAAIDLKVPSDGGSINVMGGPKTTLIADNYTHMFSIQGAKASQVNHP